MLANISAVVTNATVCCGRLFEVFAAALTRHCFKSHAVVETLNVGLTLSMALLLPPGRLAGNITHVAVSHIFLTNSRLAASRNALSFLFSLIIIDSLGCFSGTFNLSALDFLAGSLLTQKVLPSLDAVLQKGVALPLALVGATVSYNSGYIQIDADLPATAPALRRRRHALRD